MLLLVSCACDTGVLCHLIRAQGCLPLKCTILLFILFIFFYLFVLLFSYSSIKALDCLTKLKEGSPTCVVHVQSDKIMPGPGMNDSKCPTITENVHEWINKENLSDFNSPIENEQTSHGQS